MKVIEADKVIALLESIKGSFALNKYLTATAIEMIEDRIRVCSWEVDDESEQTSKTN